MGSTVVDELSLQCKLCQKDISVNLKVEHEKLHKALHALKYTKVGKTPQNVDALIKRRKQLLKRIVTRFDEATDDPKFDQQIYNLNASFDVVRSELLRERTVLGTLIPLIERIHAKDGGLCFTDKEIHNDVKSGPVWGKLPECAVGMGTSYAQNIQNRDMMQDRMTTYPQFVSLDRRKSKADTFFIGLYNGHHGPQAAELTQLYLHHFIKQEIEAEKVFLPEPPRVLVNQPSSDELESNAENGMITENLSEFQPSPRREGSLLTSYNVLRACRNGYKRMDDYLSWGINETSKVRWSSCSVATCIVTDEIEPTPQTSSPEQSDDDLTIPVGKIYIANAGNVEAYLCHNKKPFVLTQRHTTSNLKECKRIEKMGGKIVQHGRNILVNGVASTTRGLGNHGDVPLRNCVVIDPYTTTARITGNSQYVVMATASVWSVFTVDEVFNLINGTEEYLQKVKKAQETAAAESKAKPPARHCDPYLAKIEESEEELTDKIEDVVIVNPIDDEDEDDDDAIVFEDSRAQISLMAEHQRRQRLSALNISAESKHPSTFEGKKSLSPDSVRPASPDGRSQKEASLAGFAYKNWLAAAMSNRIVRAAIKAGATDNVSAAVILFQGYFHGREIDFSFLDPSQVSYLV